MNEQDQRKIARDNRAEVQRAKTGLSTRDWGIVLSAIVIAVLVLGFIYASNNPGMESAVEPAAGNTVSGSSPYSATLDQDTTNNSSPAAAGDQTSGTANRSDVNGSNSPGSSSTPDITPNPAD
jgi:hypothetical protein